MTDIKNSGMKDNDRVELSGYFDVFSHGKGFQLKKEDRTYSIIPVDGRLSDFRWEVNSYENQFEDLVSAIEFVLKEEDVSVKVHGIKEFYNIGDSE